MKRLILIALFFAVVNASFGQAPANDSCQNAIVLTPSTGHAFDTVQIDGATSDMTGCGTTEDIWFKFEVPSSGAFRIQTQQVDLNYKPYVRLFTGSCGSLAAYACEGSCQYWNASNCGDELLLLDTSLAGDTVYVRMSKRFNHTGIDAAIRILEIDPADMPVNDACENAADISTSLYTAARDTFSLFNSLVETNMATCGADEDVWVKFEVPTSGGFEIKTRDFNGDYSQYFRVFEGGCASLTAYDCDGTCNVYATSNCSDDLHVVNPNLAGDTVWVKIANRFSWEPRDSFSVDVKEIAAADVVDNDACETAADISTSLYATVRDTFTLENSLVETSLAVCGVDEDVWVKFEVPSSGGFRLETRDFNGDYNQFFRVYEGGCASLSSYACDGTCDNYSASNCSDYIQVIDNNLAGDTVWVRLSNRFPWEPRDSFSVEVTEIPSADIVANDSCGAAVDLSLSFGSTDTFTLKNAIVETGLSACGDDRDVWFKFAVPSNGAFEIETKDLDGDYDQFFRLYEGGCASLAAYDCIDGNCQKTQTSNCSDFLRVVDSTLAGDTILIRVSNRFNFDPYEEFSISIDSFEIEELKTNDDCENAAHLSVTTGSCVIDTFNNKNTTFSSVPSSACGAYSGADVWFSFVMPTSDDVLISMEQVDAISSDFRIVAYSGGCASLVEEDCNPSGNYPDLSLRNLGMAGDTVYLQVYKSNNNEVGDTFGICVKDTVLPPLRTVVGQYQKITGCDFLSGNGWFDMVDSSGNLVMSIDPNGSYLGQTCFGINVEDSASNLRTAEDTLGNEALIGPRNWFINPTSSSGAIVRLYYTEREIEIWRDSLANRGVAVGSTLEEFYQDSLRISKMDGESLTSYLGSNPVQINPTVTKVRDSILMAEFTVTSFSNFVTVFNPGSATTPIPVEWLIFEGRKEGDVVKLEWATASELNCSHFEVRESFDGRTFNTVGIVEGNGTVNSISNYSFNHVSTNNRKAYYMLKQIDFDGAFDYSEVVAIKAQTRVLVSPNPFRDAISVSAGQDEIRTIEIIDLYGRTVFTKEINATSTKVSLLDKLDHGVYVLRIITETEVLERKIIKE